MRILGTVLPTLGVVLLGACGEEVVPQPELLVAPLSTGPGCFSPIVTLAPCDEDDNTCESARASNLDAQARAEALTDPLIEVVDAIRAEPTNEQWTAMYTWPAPHDILTTFTVTATQRGAPTGAFEVMAHDVGRYVPEGDLPTDVDGTRVMYGFYTPNLAMIDLTDGILRWTSNALTIGSLYRGCDPARDVSFDQRYLDDGTFDLFCWENDSGATVDCQNVDLWPRD